VRPILRCVRGKLINLASVFASESSSEGGWEWDSSVQARGIFFILFESLIYLDTIVSEFSKVIEEPFICRYYYVHTYS
jgi:hypothetical protein